MGESIRAVELGSAVLARRGAIGKTVGILIDLTLVVLCGFLVSQLIWAFLAPTASVDLPMAATTDRDAAASVISLNANPQILQEFNPFDRSLTGVQTEAVEVDAPETTLNLSLASIWYSETEDASFVRIRTPDNSVKRFFEGETVVSGVTLDRIYQDRVILMRNGQREALLLKELSVLGSVEREQSPVKAPVRAPAPPPVLEGGESLPMGGFSGNKTIALNSFDQFMAGIDVIRQADAKGNVAIMITQNSSPVLMSELEVMPGDTLQSVNGYRFDEESLPEIYETLKAQKVLTFELERNGQSFTRTINIETAIEE